MNSSKMAKNLDTFPHVRKRNSFGNKPTSHGAHSISHQRASILKNNKNLALTLQETRCELSVYKNFFDESLEYFNKVKLAKSKMELLSATMKDFIKVFDENLLLLNFDESIWTKVKTLTRSEKIFENGMNPVIELTNEVQEEVSDNQEVNSVEKNKPIIQNTSPPSKTHLKVADEPSLNNQNSKSVNNHKRTEESIQNNIEPNSHPRDVTMENLDARTEVPNSSPKKPDNSNPVQKINSVTLPSQKVKTTKIPKCLPKALTINLKKQNFVEECKSQNKVFKRKSPEKQSEESDDNFSRRKTFVVKDSNVLTICTKNIAVPNELQPLTKEISNVSDDKFISKITKRQTFVVKKSNVAEAIESADNFNNMLAKEVVTENRVNKTTDLDVPILGNDKRKTFVKKSNSETVSHHNDISESQTSLPKGGCTVNLELPLAVSENFENNNQRKILLLPDLEFNSEVNHVTVANKPIPPESSRNLESNTEVASRNLNVIPDPSTKELKENDKNSTFHETNASDKIKEVSQNCKSKIDSVVPDQAASKTADENVDTVNKKVIFSDSPQKNKTAVKSTELSPIKTRKSFLESESDGEIIVVDEFDFGEIRPAVQTTPIRRKISKSKKKKFVFDANKRKSILKRKSFENNDFGTGDKCSEESTVVCQSDIHSNKKKVDFISNEQINEKFSNISPDASTVKKKKAKNSTKKSKDNHDTPIKNVTKKKPRKTQKVKHNEKHPSDIDMDDLISLPQKVKRKNKRKKNEDNDNAISKYVEVTKVTNEVEEAQKEAEAESEFACKKTGENTFLVRAEIHAPPPPFDVLRINGQSKENAKLNFQHMQVSVVLDDIFKSKKFEHLNISDRDFLCTKTASPKSPLKVSSSSFVIDPEESIEKFRCDPMSEADDCDLHAEAILDAGNSEVQSDPVLDIENPKPRRRKEISYKEPPVNRKMRR